MEHHAASAEAEKTSGQLSEMCYGFADDAHSLLASVLERMTGMKTKRAPDRPVRRSEWMHPTGVIVSLIRS
jgi:hypothetical protein